VLSWNLFHGRDRPPDAALLTPRSRLLRTTERGRTHAQVNRDLYPAFAGLIAGAEWDVALLQECPPRWAERLATDCEADAHLVPTSRNIPGLRRAQSLLATWNPDLIASWEGGSNLTLVRSQSPGPAIDERREHVLAHRPERRKMAMTHVTGGICVANLHASVARVAAEGELPAAARTASAWAAGRPLILGGDFNLRPARSPTVFAELQRAYGLSPPTAPDAIDHILSAGMTIVAPPRQWEPERREVPDPTREARPGLPIRLSDHAPVEALLALA